MPTNTGTNNPYREFHGSTTEAAKRSLSFFLKQSRKGD